MYLHRKIIIFLFLGFVAFFKESIAQNPTFYIEGDQETPIYVKVEGTMVDRLGKNYAIISNLAAGYTNFEILFELNKYPSQKFTLLVPESDSRGFILTQVEPGTFALFDMDQKRFILAGNSKEDDVYVEKSLEEQRIAQNKAQKNELKFKKEDWGALWDREKAKDLAQRYGKTQMEEKETSKNELEFIDDISLNKKNGNSKADIRINEAKADTSLPPIPNTDCPESMDNRSFENIALRFIDIKEDSDKLSFIRRRTQKQCFSTEQVRILASNMESQSGKFELIKMLYVQTSDQEYFFQLEEVFQSNYLKNEFRKMVNK